MIKNLLKVFMLAAFIVAAGHSSALAADTERFEIVNDSDMAIAFLYVAPMHSEDWGSDRVGDEIMNCGDYRTVNYDPQYSYKIKIRLAGEGGETFTWYDINLSDTWRLSIWYNGTDFELSKNSRG